MRAFFLAVLISFPAATLVAQDVADRPAFEVASVKPHDRSQLARPESSDPARISGTSTMTNLIMVAYSVKPYQILGPDWLLLEAYDIEAKYPAGKGRQDLPELFQDLLNKRFGFTSHWEVRDQKVYALVVGNSGPKLTPSAADAKPRKSASTSGHIDFTAQLLSALADYLTNCCFDKPVVDETNIQFRVDISLDLVSDKSDSVDKSSAATESLIEHGLKLKPSTRQVRYLIIDAINKAPSPN